MPKDQDLDHFPFPPKSNDSSSSDSPSITDPIAPDISASPKSETTPTPNLDKPETEAEITPEPKLPPDTDTPPPEPKTEPTKPKPELKPASPPKSTSKTLFIVIFLLLTLAGISTAVFLYTQNNELKDLVSNLNSDIQQQEIADRASLPPTDEPTIATSSTGFTIPTTSPSPITISTSSSSSPSQTFAIFDSLFELATSKYPDAQLLLISTVNLQQDTPIIKYYFRQEPDKVKYFYILNDPDTGPTLFDQQVWVSPDDNIPSLNDRAKNDQLGIDLDTTLNLTNSLCSENHSDCDQATSIKAQFIDSNITLWQIVYQLPGSSSPLVYQINSQTQDIIFRSDN